MWTFFFYKQFPRNKITTNEKKKKKSTVIARKINFIGHKKGEQ